MLNVKLMNHPSSRINRLGITLIEMLIVVTLTVLLTTAAAAMLYSTIHSGGQANNLSLVKTNGDYALSQMEFLLRNAITLEPNTLGQTCSLGMNEIRARSRDEAITRYFRENDNGIEKIASNSGRYLTSDAVRVVSGPVFDCTQSEDNAVQTVTISFTLAKGVAGQDRVSEVIQEDFATTVTMRKF